MKTCTTCKESKTESEFYEVVPGRLRSNCKTCHKLLMKPRSKAHYEKNKDYYQARNKKARKLLQEYVSSLKTQPCADCKQSFPPWVMQFDHLPGSIKLHNISEMSVLQSKAVIDEEVAKCEVVCANCHANRTYTRRSK